MCSLGFLLLILGLLNLIFNTGLSRSLLLFLCLVSIAHSPFILLFPQSLHSQSYTFSHAVPIWTQSSPFHQAAFSLLHQIHLSISFPLLRFPSNTQLLCSMLVWLVWLCWKLCWAWTQPYFRLLIGLGTPGGRMNFMFPGLHCRSPVSPLEGSAFSPPTQLRTRFIGSDFLVDQQSVAKLWVQKTCWCPFTRGLFILKMAPPWHCQANWSQQQQSGPRLEQNLPESHGTGVLNLWASGSMDGARTCCSQESSRAACGAGTTDNWDRPAANQPRCIIKKDWLTGRSRKLNWKGALSQIQSWRCPLCFVTLVNASCEVGRTMVVHGYRAGRGRSAGSVRKDWAPHRQAPALCHWVVGIWSPKCLGLLVVTSFLAPLVCAGGRDQTERTGTGEWDVMDVLKFFYFPGRIHAWCWTSVYHWISGPKRINTGKDNLGTIAKHSGEGFIDLRARRDYYHHLVWLPA